MAFANQYVASIVYKNKIQREFNNHSLRTVQLPFDSEYSIRVQNKNGFKALVDICIDGISIFSADKKLLLNPYQTVDVERFVSSLKEGKKFKFVNFDKAVSEGHQDPTSALFGLVEITYTPQIVNRIDNTIYTDTFLRSFDLNRDTTVLCSNVVFGNSLNSVTYTSNNNLGSINCNYESGGTVEGSQSSQEFSESSELINWDTNKQTKIVIKLVGEQKDEYPKSVIIDNKTLVYQWMNKNPDGSISIHYK